MGFHFSKGTLAYQLHYTCNCFLYSQTAWKEVYLFHLWDVQQSVQPDLFSQILWPKQPKGRKKKKKKKRKKKNKTKQVRKKIPTLLSHTAAH